MTAARCHSPVFRLLWVSQGFPPHRGCLPSGRRRERGDSALDARVWMPSSMGRALSAAALLGVIYLTKPTQGSFGRAFRSWLRRREGLLGEALARGAMALDSFLGPSDAFQDFKLFVLVQLKPAPEGTESALGALFDNDVYFGAVGVVGQWIGVRVPAGGALSPQIFYIGSALD
eukprot:scaffold62829_cov28-Tisochrysis_lutea.AAC.1